MKLDGIAFVGSEASSGSDLSRHRGDTLPYLVMQWPLGGYDTAATRIADARGGKDWPPVIILNMSYSGLGIARDLSGSGIRVVGLSADRKHVGIVPGFVRCVSPKLTG